MVVTFKESPADNQDKISRNVLTCIVIDETKFARNFKERSIWSVLKNLGTGRSEMFQRITWTNASRENSTHSKHNDEKTDQRKSQGRKQLFRSDFFFLFPVSG